MKQIAMILPPEAREILRVAYEYAEHTFGLERKKIIEHAVQEVHLRWPEFFRSEEE